MEDAPLNRYVIHNWSRAEERALIRRAQAGDIDARNAIVVNFMPAAIKFAKRYGKAKGYSGNDLAQEGAIGLMTAIEKFNFKYDTKFISYAHYWLQRMMTPYVNKNKTAISLPTVPSDESKIVSRQGISGFFEGLQTLPHKHRHWVDEYDAFEEFQVWYAKAKKWLHPQHFKLVEMRACGMTLDDIGTILDITRERVRQLLEKSYEKIERHS